MKLLFISSLLVAATNAADVDRRRINGITFADQAIEALNIVHKGQSTTEQKLVATRKGEDKSDNKGDDKSSDNSKSRDNKSSSSSSKSSGGSSSRDGRGVCGESDGYCKDYDSSSFLNIKKEGGNNKGGDKSSRDDNKSDDKSSKSKSSSSNSKSSSSSGDGSSRTDRCFRACDTDRCTSDDRRRLECPASTAASSDFVQKGQASPIQKLVATRKGDDNKSDNKGDDKSSRDDKSSDKSSKSSSSKSSGGRSSRDGRGVCGESDGYCKDYDSSSFLNIKKEGGNNKGGDKSSRDDNKSDDKSSKSKSSSSNSKFSSSSGDGSSRTDRCFRACDTDRCTSDDRRRLECPASTAASSDMLKLKGQASPIQKLVAAKKESGKGNDGKERSSDNSKSRDNKSSSSKSSSSKSGSGSRDGRGVCGESDGYCKDYDSSSFLNIKKEGGNNKGGDKSSRDSNKDDSSKSKSSSSNSKSSSSSGDGSSRTDRCFRACDTDRCTSDDRRRLECPASTAASSDFVQKGQVAATKKLRGRA